jgi:TPP-dependent pyruvate/acetoin dehydrogenase alpha subunit
MAEAAFENPLIPNARLRQIYLAMMRARALARTLKPVPNTLGLEACLVSTAVDLGPGDLVSDALTGAVVDLLRGANLRSVLRPGKTSKPGADHETAARLPAASGTEQRIWAALGAAATVKAEHARARADAKASGKTAQSAGVVLVYAQTGETKTALWRAALAFAARHELPVVFVALPPSHGKTVQRARLGAASALALGCGVPGIAVDIDDAVAIYRVAQESIGRARAGGGPALIDCIPFIVAGEKRTPSTDALADLERSLLLRRVCTQAWLDREARSFASRLARAQNASKERFRRMSAGAS